MYEYVALHAQYDLSLYKVVIINSYCKEELLLFYLLCCSSSFASIAWTIEPICATSATSTRFFAGILSPTLLAVGHLSPGTNISFDGRFASKPKAWRSSKHSLKTLSRPNT